MTQDLPLWVQALASVFLVTCGLFALIGAIGMQRFDDFLMRLHTPTLATTLGVGGALLASMLVGAARGEFAVGGLLVTLFLFITAPVSANMIAEAALHLRVPSKAPVPPDLPHR